MIKPDSRKLKLAMLIAVTAEIPSAGQPPKEVGRVRISPETRKLEQSLNRWSDCPRGVRPIEDIPDWVLNGG
ncbi:MAG: hypothetical protein ABL907_22775 [Hyphomicrobium sp.]